MDLDGLPPMQERGARGVRGESPTNQLRMWHKQQVRRRSPLRLEPLPIRHHREGERLTDKDTAAPKHTLGPLTTQRLIDDFVAAAGAGDAHKVAEYIRSGIPIDRQHSILRYNALHASAALQSGDVARRLLEAGADPDALTQEHETALHLAARFGAQAVVEELILHAADKRVVNKKGMIPMEVAADVQNRKLEQLLEPPPNSPTDVCATEISSTAVAMAWETTGRLPSPCLFKVAWAEATAGDPAWNERECSEPVFTVTDLLPATRYVVRVTAGSHLIGWSAMSSPVAVRTLNDVPSAVAAPTVTEVGNTFMKLAIQLPRENGTAISRVMLQFKRQGSAFQALEPASPRQSTDRRPSTLAEPVEDWKAQTWMLESASSGEHDADRSATSLRQQGDSMEFMISDLAPGQIYIFRAKASNADGWSVNGEPSDGVSTEVCPQIVSIAARSMTLAWTRAISRGQVADAYRVDARLDKSELWETVASTATDETCVVHRLIPFSAYYFRVVPHFQGTGWTDPARYASSKVAITLAAPPEPPVNFHVVDRDALSITVAWGLPRCNGHAVVSYAIEARQRSQEEDETSSCPITGRTSEWRLVDDSIPVSAEFYAVTGLESGHAYCVRVCARNALGSGEFTELFEGSKKRYELQICQLEGGESSLRMSLDQLHIRSLGWTSTAADVLETEATVSGLLPLRYYCFRVRVTAVHIGGTKLPVKLGGEQNSWKDETSAFSRPSEPIQTLRRC